MDKQALQRAHRIGQMNHVLSINLVTEHSVEEVSCRTLELHVDTQNLIDWAFMGFKFYFVNGV